MNRAEIALHNIKDDTVKLEKLGGQSSVSVEDIALIEEAVQLYVEKHGLVSSYSADTVLDPRD